MRHEREPSYESVKLSPHNIECGGILGHGFVDAMNLLGEIAEVVFRFGFDQLVKTVGDYAVFNLHGSDRADA